MILTEMEETKMKKFGAPELNVQRLDAEEIISTSGGKCFEINACVDCYCTSVTCEGVWECDGLLCPSLSDFD